MSVQDNYFSLIVGMHEKVIQISDVAPNIVTGVKVKSMLCFKYHKRVEASEAVTSRNAPIYHDI